MCLNNASQPTLCGCNYGHFEMPPSFFLWRKIFNDIWILGPQRGDRLTWFPLVMLLMMCAVVTVPHRNLHIVLDLWDLNLILIYRGCFFALCSPLEVCGYSVIGIKYHHKSCAAGCKYKIINRRTSNLGFS